jgi:hypothetical protein
MDAAAKTKAEQTSPPSPQPQTPSSRHPPYPPPRPFSYQVLPPEAMAYSHFVAAHKHVCPPPHSTGSQDSVTTLIVVAAHSVADFDFGEHGVFQDAEVPRASSRAVLGTGVSVEQQGRGT